VIGDDDFRAKLERLPVTLGTNRAAVAVFRSMRVVIQYMPKVGTQFREMGSGCYAGRDPRKQIARLRERIDRLTTLVSAPA
jgi:hypothetical protein